MSAIEMTVVVWILKKLPFALIILPGNCTDVRIDRTTTDV